MSPKRWLPAAVAAAALAAYANTLWNGFVWDDILLVVDNPSIKSWSALPHLFSRPLAPKTLYYRPLQALTLMADYAVAGLRPGVFHLTNVALHAAAAVLLYHLATRILRDSTAGFVAALLFAVHPVHTEAVAYVAGRADSLAAIGLLGALLLRGRPALSAAAFLAALLARESAFAFLLLALLVDVGRVLPDEPARRRPWPRYAAYLAALALYLALRAVAVHDSPAPAMSTAEFPLHVRLLTMVKVVAAYLGVLVLPVDLHMERIVPAATSVMDSAVLWSAALLAVLAALVTRVRTAAWPVAFGGAWFLVALLPVANIVPLDAFMAEHWLYVPSMGPCMAVGWLAAQGLRGRFGRVVAAVLVAGLGACAARTIVRNTEWRNELSLFEATVRDSPTSSRALSNLGRAHLEAGDTRRAADLNARALSLAATPRQAATAHANLGLTYYTDGRHQEAVDECRRAIEANGPDAIVYANLAAALVALGRPKEAEEALARAIATDPGYAPAHVNLGVVLEELGQPERARQSYLRALEIDPDSFQAHLGLGDVYLAEGRPDLAEEAYGAALRLEPGLPALRERLESARKARSGAP